MTTLHTVERICFSKSVVCGKASGVASPSQKDKKLQKIKREKFLSNHNLESKECAASLTLSLYSRYANIFLFID